MPIERRVYVLAGLIVLAACSSTGVVPVSQDEYMISKESAAGIFGTPAGVEADIFREANDFCTARQEIVQTVNVQTQNAVTGSHQAYATLYFRCVPPKQETPTTNH